MTTRRFAVGILVLLAGVPSVRADEARACPPPLEASCLLREAFAAVERLESGYERSAVLRRLALAQAAAGDTGAARQTLATALAMARSMRGGFIRARVLYDIAITQRRVGDTPGAQQALAFVLETADEPDKGEEQAALLGKMAAVQETLGETAAARKTLVAALEIARTLPDKATRARVLRGLAEVQAEARQDRAIAQAEAGNVPGALETTKEITGLFGSVRASALGSIAAVQWKTGDTAGAQQTLAAALATAHRAPASDAAFAFQQIASAQAQVGNVPGALEIVPRLQEALFQSLVFIDIAAAQAKAGQIAEALETTRRIQGSHNQAWALGDIAAAQVKAGHSEEALTLVRGIAQNEPRAVALGKVAVALGTVHRP